MGVGSKILVSRVLFANQFVGSIFWSARIGYVLGQDN